MILKKYIKEVFAEGWQIFKALRVLVDKIMVL